MLKLAVRNTRKIVRQKAKEENKRIGRSFTKAQTAAYMASLVSLPAADSISILDAGAGTGILAAALIERICTEGKTKEIRVTAAECDATLVPMLKINLEKIRKKCRHDYGVKLLVTVKEGDFLADGRDAYEPSLFSVEADKYDIVLTNPPTGVCEKNSPEALATPDICYGATDRAFIFTAMALSQMKENGQLVAVLPTSFASGAYLAPFRKKLLDAGVLAHLHLFLSHAKAEGDLDGLCRSLIVHIKGGAKTPENIRISTSYGEGDATDAKTLAPLPYRSIVRDDGEPILLVKSDEEWAIWQAVRALPATLSSLGLKMRTGLVIESKCADMLSDAPGEKAIPILRPQGIQFGHIRFPLNTKGEYITPDIPSLAQKNRNMLVIKRVPAKNDRRRLVCAIYLAAQLPLYRYISTHNKLNFVDYTDDREMDSAMLHGLFAVLGSSIYDKYCRICSATPQISSKEYGDLPLPDEATLRAIGGKMIMLRQYSEKACDALIKGVINVQ